MRGQAQSRRPSWLLFLIFGALVSATYFAVSSPVVKVVSFGVLGAAPVAAMLIGVRMHRPRYPMSWFLFAVGLLVFNVGDMIFYVHEYLLLREPPFPSVADAFYLATYPCLIAGLLLLIKHRSPGRNRASLVDALIVAISMGLLSWEFLMVPYLRERGLSLSERLTSLAYPLMDILVLAVTARLWSDGGVRNGAFHLLSLSLVPLLLADTLYGLIQLTGTWHLGSPVDVGWMLFYVCWGAAAMHPSMRQLDRPAPTATVKITRARFGVLLALASLMAPIVLAVQVALGHPVDIPVVVGGSLLLFLLALVRMSGIVQALRITLTKHERSVARETTLREAAEAFVAATTRDSIHTAALDAVLALSKDPRRTTVRIADGDQGNLKIVAAAGEPGKVIGTVFDLSKLAGSNLDLDGGTVVTGWAEAQELYERLQLDPALASLLLLPLRLQRGLGGVLVVASRWRQPDEIVEALQALSAQAALALESATLTEDLHQRRSDERFRRLVQNSSDLITVMETDSTIRYQTPSVQRVLGYEADELIGRKLAELIHPDDAASLVALLTGTSRDGVNGPYRMPDALQRSPMGLGGDDQHPCRRRPTRLRADQSRRD